MRWAFDPARLRRFEISLILSIALVLGVLVFTGGALLYAIDWTGIYTPGGFFVNPTVNEIIPAAASGVSFGNVYVGQYLSLFVDTFVCTYAAQRFTRELFRSSFTDAQLTGVQFLAAALFLVNLYNVTWGYYTFEFNLYLSNAGFFLVMTQLVRLVRAGRAGRAFSMYDSILLGLGIGLSAPASFPNVLRTLAIEGIGFVLVFLGILAGYPHPGGRRAMKRTVLRILVFAAPIAFALLAAPLYIYLTEWAFQPAAVSAVVFVNSTPTANSYNTLANVVRLLGKGQFATYSYYSLYSSNALIVVASSLWPLLALPGALVLSRLAHWRDRLWVPAMILAIIPCLIWGEGTNPPFGLFNQWLYGQLPYGTQLMPAFFPLQTIATKLYPVLIAFAIGTIYAEWQFRQRYSEGLTALPIPPGAVDPVHSPPPATRSARLRRFRRNPEAMLPYVVTGALVGMVLIAALPIYDGAIYDLPGHLNQRPFWIPNAYYDVRSTLQGDRANALMLPTVGAYVGTTWGMRAATQFYEQFNYPSRVVVPGYYGPYKYFINTTKEQYFAVTHPLLPSGVGTPIAQNGTGPWIELHRAVEPRYVYTFAQNLNLSSYDWLNLTIPVGDPGLIAQQVQQRTFWIGIMSGQSGHSSVGWYVIGQDANSALVSLNASLDVNLFVGSPNTGPGVNSTEYPSNVTGVTIWFRTTSAIPILPPTEFGLPVLTGIVGSIISPDWAGLLAVYQTSFLLVDSTVVYGEYETPTYVTTVTTLLQSQHLITSVYQSPDLQMYRFT
ncbi:MAG: hypothetical protein WA761_02845 [Thermoplasmata archaeon]